MFVLWSLTAWASECAQPFTAAEVEAVASAAQQAIEEDDAARFRERYRQFTRGVPCLEGPVPVEPWARLLVLDAVVRLSEGRDPGPPLGTALRIAPGVAVPEFLRSRGSPEGLGPPERLADGAKAWLDGQPVKGFPGSLVGDHVFQRQVGGRMESAIGSAAPKGWTAPAPAVPDRPDRPERPRTGGAPLARVALAGAGLGAERVAQVPEEPGDFVPEADALSPTLGLAGEVGRDLAGRFGVVGRLAQPVRVGRLSGGGIRVAPRVELAADAAVGPLRVEVGALLAFTPTLQAGKNRPKPDVLPVVGARWWGEAFDAGASVALWPDSARALARAGWTLDAEALGGSVRVGLDAGWHGRGFRQEVPGGPRRVRASGLEALAQVGVIWR